MAYVLIGFMGAGKSTVARELAEALGGAPFDSDGLMEERLGHAVAEEFERAGEAAFREREEALACELLDAAGERDVVALGGGTVLSERVRAALSARSHVTVLLEIEPDRAWERVSSGPAAGKRPLARDRGEFLSLHGRRLPLYEALADAYLPELPLGGAGAVLPALEALSHSPSGTRMLWARADSGEYPVLVGRGLLAPHGAGIERAWPLDRTRSRPFCVTDETVAPLYGDRMGELAGTLAIAPGEEHKTLADAERVWGRLIDAQITRADHLVALGGGVVGDLAGFCAATYQRGVPVVHVPTTLVAQVDSAYGGKTGVDLPQAKNYVGAYHQPAGVLVDPDTLSTLPPREASAGWVEVLKTALIAGGELWERVSGGGEPEQVDILACARTKLAVVARDERDGGARQALNLGHTIGHAVEAATGYTRYRHGEAVGIGLLATLRLSGQQDLRDRVAALLQARSLPTSFEGARVEEVLAALARDKKRVADRVPFVLVRAPGDVQVGCEVDEPELRAAVEEVAR
jgi:shikimate kinase/3-dehydroquinate synthase